MCYTSCFKIIFIIKTVHSKPSVYCIQQSTFSFPSLSLKALHVQLISVCVEAEVDLSVSASSSPSMTSSVSCTQESEHGNRSPVKTGTSTQQQVNKLFPVMHFLFLINTVTRPLHLFN